MCACVFISKNNKFPYPNHQAIRVQMHKTEKPFFLQMTLTLLWKKVQVKQKVTELGFKLRKSDSMVRALRPPPPPRLGGRLTSQKSYLVHVCCLSVSLTLCSPGNCSGPGSSVQLQARLLEWVAISSSRGSS